VFAGGRIKHMSLGMNDVLKRSFGRLDVSLARQKSRVLTAREPQASEMPVLKRKFESDLGLWICAAGGVFAGTGLDIGTRALASRFHQLPEYETAIDLASGSGILAALLARKNPQARIIASDVSAAAVRSTIATAEANDLRVEAVQDVGLYLQPSDSADLIVLNPPFHSGAAVTKEIALDLFEDAGRVLRPGGELWAVWNSPLDYKPDLVRSVGRTREINRTAKFTISSSRKDQ
jgi:16S rRNA (guanine1207-N2)-methyltransferase